MSGPNEGPFVKFLPLLASIVFSERITAMLLPTENARDTKI